MRFVPLSGGTQILMWAEATLLWTIANYVMRDPLKDDLEEKRWKVIVILRNVIAALLILAIASSVGGIWLATLALLLGIVLPLARRYAAVSYCVAIEIAFSGLFVAASHQLIAQLGIGASWGLVNIRASNERIAALSFVVALGLFVINGGTYIVRGILSKSGALPNLSKEVPISVKVGELVMNGHTFTVSGDLRSEMPKTNGSDTRQVDEKEYNRGRLIGSLERILLLVVVMAGSYEALAFLVAAKGLIRSKDLENREWAEYFLVGSLASVLVALAAGLIAHYAMETLK